MRPIKLGPFAPITALTTAFNALTFTSTGAAVAPTTTATTDLLAHTVTLTAAVQTTLAGITFTIVGTDQNGNAQTETGIVGPASGATVTSTKYFKTITTVQPSATMGGLLVSIGVSAISLTQVIPLDRRSVASAGLTVAVTGTINYTVNETFADVFDLSLVAPYTPITALTTKSATTSATTTVSATGVELIVNSVTNNATFTIYLNQASSALG